MSYVNFVKTRSPQGYHRTILIVDDETEITWDQTENGAEISVRNVGLLSRDYDPAKTLTEAGANDPGFWGQWIVWADPLTVAHAVMDVINNQ